jgi:hypothetical protein
VRALAVFDDGTGLALYATGGFSRAGGAPANRIARWNGSQWSALGAGLSLTYGDTSYALVVFDNGMGPALYAGGGFSVAGNGFAELIARWNGTAWSRLESGTAGSGIFTTVHAIEAFDNGTTSALYFGSVFIDLAPQANHPLVEFDGTSSRVIPNSVDGSVNALKAFDDGSGPALYVGGAFTHAGGIPANRIARFDGTTWSPIGTGLDGTVNSLEVFDDGSGPALYAGGEFTQAGGLTVNRIARWNGSAWSALESGIAGSTNSVYALEVFDDGSGAALYVGGDFFLNRGAPGDAIVRWNGSRWSEVGGGMDAGVNAFSIFDDGRGPALYAGGDFFSAGPTTAFEVARWDGTTWSALGPQTAGFFPSVLALATFDDSTGSALYAGGYFTAGAGIPGADYVARWNGSAWSALAGGMDGRVHCFASFTDPRGPALYAGGLFAIAGGVISPGVAAWRGSSEIPRRGNVNVGTGVVSDVLFVNGSAGDPNRIVTVTAGAPLELRLDRAPNGPSTASYVLWAWPAEPSHAVELYRREERIGCLVNPTPFQRTLLPQPVICLRSPSIRSIVCRGVPERSSPAQAPFAVPVPGGIRRPGSLTVQGIIQDDLAANSARFSITNATVIRAQ